MPLSCCMEVGNLYPHLMQCDGESEKTNVRLNRLELEDALEIQSVIPEYQFKHPHLLLQAFTHTSYTRSARSSVGDNERLEFSGDALLNFIVSEYLRNTYYVSSGVLSELKMILCSNETLTSVGRQLGFDRYIRRSRGEERLGGPSDKQIANTVEAVICAINIDGGIEGAWKFISAHILPLLPDLLEARVVDTDGLDPKSALQKFAQTKLGMLPKYKVLKYGGTPPHTKTHVAVFLGERELSRAYGKNKREAEKEAAKLGLKVLKNER